MACLCTCLPNDRQHMRPKIRLRSSLAGTDVDIGLSGDNMRVNGFVQCAPRQIFGHSHSSLVWKKSTIRRPRSSIPCLHSRQRLSKLWTTTHYQKAIVGDLTNWPLRPITWTRTRLLDQQFAIEILMSGADSSKYEPSEDDRAETTSSSPMELTLAQQLLMKQYEEQIERMTAAECRKLSVEIARQMMVKDNIMKSILKDDTAIQMITSATPPPDPADFQSEEDKEE